MRTIADLTNLAVPTVSRALAGAPQISADTRELVARVAREIGYTPDRAALRLRTGRTNVLSLLMDPHEEILEFGTSLLRGITEAAKGTPYHIIVTPNFQDGPSIEPINFILKNRLADGIIFTRTEPFDPRVRLLLEHDFPFVTHGRTEFSTAHPYVDFDNAAFAYEAASRLIARGRRKLSIILPQARLMFGQHLRHGFMTAIRNAGVAFEIPDTVTLDSSVREIRDYVRLRMRADDPPDAFVCSGEVSALATISGLGDCGMVLGREYDMVAKQTSPLLGDIHPGVDTIYEDLAAAGEAMGRLLLRRITGQAAETLHVLQTPDFGRRQSEPEQIR